VGDVSKLLRQSTEFGFLWRVTSRPNGSEARAYEVATLSGANLRPQRNDDFLWFQTGNAIPGLIARLILTIGNIDWTLCASRNHRRFLQGRTAHWLRFGSLSNPPAGADPVDVACPQLICRNAAAIFPVLELTVSQSGPRPTTQLAHASPPCE
jgi:hypothetical protein